MPISEHRPEVGSTAQESKEAALIDPVLETMDRDLKIAPWTRKFDAWEKGDEKPLFEAWEHHGKIGDKSLNYSYR